MRSEFLGAPRRSGGLDPSRRPFGGRIGRLGAALGLAAFVALSAGVAAAASQVSPPDGSPKFLRLPFSDPGVAHGQGWY